MNDYAQAARRATVGKNVLDVMAFVFLLCSIGFWGVIHWVELVGPRLPSVALLPQAIVALAMTAIYALALPLLLSMLVPTTPAGQMLQKTQWRTVGFSVVIASVFALGYWAITITRAWFMAQPAVATDGLNGAYVIGTLVGFIVIPALAWVQVTPERWRQQIQQAHEVNKLEIMQQGEIAILQTRLLWAKQKAAIGYVNLLPAEQQEVRDTLQGLLMGISDSQRSIVRSLHIQGEVEREILGDEQIASELDYVAQQLERPARMIDKAVTVLDDTGREIDDLPERREMVAHVNQASETLKPRGELAAPRSAAPRYAAEYATANQRLEPLFTVRQVARLLGDMPERTARDVVDAWHAQGWVESGNIRGQWRFVE